MSVKTEVSNARVTAKLVMMVVLITVGLILVLLNLRQAQPINLIVTTVYLPPAATILISFGLGAGFMVLVYLVRKARRR